MASENLDIKKLSDRALRIFEERNSALRILYDTIIEVELAPDSGIFPIILKNLKKLTDGEIALIASFQKEYSCLKLEYSDPQSLIEGVSEKSRVLDEGILGELLRTKIQSCSEHQCCIPGLFTLTVPSVYLDEEKYRWYRLCFVYKEKLVAVAAIAKDLKKRMKVKDIVETFLNISSIMLERVYTSEDLKRSRMRYKAVVEDQDDLIARFLPSGEITFSNLAFRRRFDVEKKGFSEIFNDGNRKVVEEILSTVSRENPVVFREITPDGSGIWLHLGIRGLYNAAGELIEYQAVGRDITELKEMEVKMRQSQKMEAVATLSAGIAHEINTPLQYILNNVSFFEQSFKTMMEIFKNSAEPSSECCKKIAFLKEEIPFSIQDALEGITKVKEIVEAMKIFSNVNGEGIQIANLNKAIESAVVVSGNIWKDNARIDLKLDRTLPAIRCHVDDINQVLLNLIINASDAIRERKEIDPMREGVITIRTGHQNDEIFFEVGDNGTGIDPCIRDRVFDMFFTTKPVGKGTGTGLAYCHDVVVKRHGGSIKIYGTPEGGAGFRVLLPIS